MAADRLQGVPLRAGWDGWWNKATLFAPPTVLQGVRGEGGEGGEGGEEGEEGCGGGGGEGGEGGEGGGGSSDVALEDIATRMGGVGAVASRVDGGDGVGEVGEVGGVGWAPRGRVMYIDLDTIITGDLNEIAAYGGDFALLGTQDLDNEGGEESVCVREREKERREC